MTEAEYGEYIAMFNAACAGDGSAPHVVFEHRIENGDRDPLISIASETSSGSVYRTREVPHSD